MKDDFIDMEMATRGADGVDFVPLSFDEKHPIPIYCSFTKEQWEHENLVPKTNRKYWKLGSDGRKQYIK